MARTMNAGPQPRGPARVLRRGVPGGRQVTVLAAVLTLGLMTLGATADTEYAAHSVDAPSDGQQEGGRWGERSAPAGDLDGDGVTDLFVGQPKWDSANHTDEGRVYALDGADLANGDTTVLYVIESPQPQTDARFGFFISVPGDIVGGSDKDIVVGTENQDVEFENEGKAWVFDGEDPDPDVNSTSDVKNTAAFALENPEPQKDGEFGERLGRAGDLDGDEVADIIAGAPGNDAAGNSGQGQAFVFSGVDSDDDGQGELLYTINMPEKDQQADATFGIAVQSPGDLGEINAFEEPVATQDGQPDLLVNAVFYDGNKTNEGRSYLYSATDNDDDKELDEDDLLTRLDSPQDQSVSFFGFQDAKPLSPGDVNDDDIPDLYQGAFRQDVDFNDDGTQETDVGKAWVFDGKASIEDPDDSDGTNGVPLYEANDPTPEKGGSFGWSLAKTMYNDDTIPDLYVGQAPHHTPDLGSGNGGTYVFDGTDQDPGSENEEAAVFKKLELPQDCRQQTTSGDKGPALGWTVSAPGDLNGDENGDPDYVAGAPFFNTDDLQDEGMLFGFMSGETTDDIPDC